VRFKLYVSVEFHNEELNDLYSLPNNVPVVKIENDEMGGACGEYGRRERCAQAVGGEA
jgi:hypothetical protein